MEKNDAKVHEADPAARRGFWDRPLVLVLVSITLSSLISGAVVSFGWKASIDTTTAVYSVKLSQQEDRVHQLELSDKDRIKASDLAFRDQLLDAKLSLLQAEIAGVKEQLASMRVEKR